MARVADSLAQAGQGDRAAGIAAQAAQAATAIQDPEKRIRALATLARSVETDGGGEMIYNTVCEVLLSPYARAYLDAIPVAVIERLLTEGRQL